MSDLLTKRFKDLQDDPATNNSELELLRQELIITKEFIAETGDALARYRNKLKNIQQAMVKVQTWLPADWYEVCRELYLNNQLETLFAQIELDIAANKIQMYEVKLQLKALAGSQAEQKNIHLGKVPLSLKLRFDAFQEKYKVNALRMILFYKLQLQNGNNN